ncbi:NnrS family protein [Micavibrio aeruginosavorus]|uniref:NnrS protein involved in response to NO n=1 Tax=Micavibrio aeruginosavorus EPB TaxID=349215 RepID=M4VEK5_9BACT|nr:NnrS family protein [Micavibrio aeruginosavorus]AGH97658.1 NnrS protein involved in response to NO [Micavibrio aeruginosavorus EPB]
MLKPSNKLFSSPFWGRGFRPFFFSGAIFAIISICAWGAFYAGTGIVPPTFMLNPVAWHAHEMIYGFSMAIVAGFLLTAVANWTGGAPARQIHLATLCFLWWIGRIAMGIDLGLPQWSSIMLELLFIPALAISLALPLFRSWNKRNFIFLSILTILFGCDAWFMLTANMTPLYVALMMILMMVSLIGGRVIPAFTVAALRRQGIKAFQTDQPKMDIAALLSLVLVTITLVFAKDSLVFGVSAAISCVIHAIRMRHYHTLSTFNDPLVWILHAGYAWLVLGLGLFALVGFDVFPINAVVHAMTAGCIGSMVIGMMCRVTLGHTGRALKVDMMTTVSFVTIQAVALMRVFGPMIMPEHSTSWIIYSAALWVACFSVYLFCYSGFLFAPRPDGQEA